MSSKRNRIEWIRSLQILVIALSFSCYKTHYSNDFIPKNEYSGEYELSIVDVATDNYDSLRYLLNFLFEERVQLIVINDSSIAENVTEDITNHLVIIPRSYTKRPKDNAVNEDFYKYIKIECEENVIGFFAKKIGRQSGMALYHPAAEIFLRLYPDKFDDFLGLNDFIKIDYHFGSSDIIVASPNDVYRYDFKDIVIITNLENEAQVDTPYNCYYDNPYSSDENQNIMKSSHLLVNSVYTLINNHVTSKKPSTPWFVSSRNIKKVEN